MFSHPYEGSSVVIVSSMINRGLHGSYQKNENGVKRRENDVERHKNDTECYERTKQDSK